MIDPTLILQNDYSLRAASDEDWEQLRVYSPGTWIHSQLTGSQKVRSLQELHCYWGSCRYISSLRLNGNMATKEKVDRMTRVYCGFVDGPFYDAAHDRVYWIPKHLNYRTCNQKDSHDFIAEALERHANLAGVKLPENAPASLTLVDYYVDMLRTL